MRAVKKIELLFPRSLLTRPRTRDPDRTRGRGSRVARTRHLNLFISDLLGGGAGGGSAGAGSADGGCGLMRLGGGGSILSAHMVVLNLDLFSSSLLLSLLLYETFPEESPGA